MITLKIKTMTTIEKIQLVLTNTQINKLRTDIEFTSEDYSSQNINNPSFECITSMLSLNSRKNLELIQRKTWEFFGGGEMVTIYQSIEALKPL